jgi:ATPase subunit of ABC transporter with duplicated ATPase domains
MQAKGVGINDDAGLEAEADAMGAKALQRQSDATTGTSQRREAQVSNPPRVRQDRADMKKRKRLKKEAQQAIKILEAEGPKGNNADPGGLQAHDRAMSPGQHHAFRNVKRSMLIGDLEQRISDHTDNNLRDSDAIGVKGTPPATVLQLVAENVAPLAQTAVVVQRTIASAAIFNDHHPRWTARTLTHAKYRPHAQFAHHRFI